MGALARNELIYRYKSRTADAKFDKFDNALDILNKIRNGKTSLTDLKIIKQNLNQS